MGDQFFVAKDIRLPAVVRELGEAIESCQSVWSVRFMRIRHEPPSNIHPETVAFKEGNGRRVIVELYYQRKKYLFDITPNKEWSLSACVDEIIDTVRHVAPSFVIKEADIFREIEKKTLEKVPVIDFSIHDEPVAAVGKEDILTTQEEAVMKEQSVVGAVNQLHHVPAGIWRPRQLAVYCFLHDQLWSGTDPNHESVDPTYQLKDEFQGRIYGLYPKLMKYFEVASGFVGDAIKPLQKYHVLKQEFLNGKPDGWWILSFVDNVPLISLTPKEIWGSVVKGRRTKTDENTKELPTIPNPLWGPRQLAIYHFVCDELWRNENADFQLVDTFHGKVRSLFKKVSVRFGMASGSGSVTRALMPLRDAHILENEIVEGGKTDWSLVHFVKDAPEASRSLEDLWNSVSYRPRRKTSLPMEPPRVQEPEPEQIFTHATESDQIDLVGVVSVVEEKLRLIERLQNEVREDAHMIMRGHYEEIATLARVHHVSVLKRLESVRSLLRAEDCEEADRVLALLAALAKMGEVQLKDTETVVPREEPQILHDISIDTEPEVEVGTRAKDSALEILKEAKLNAKGRNRYE